MIGPEGDVTDMGHEGHAARLELIQPFLKPEELQAFKHMDYRGWRAKVCRLHTDIGNSGFPNAWPGLACVYLAATSVAKMMQYFASDKVLFLLRR